MGAVRTISPPLIDLRTGGLCVVDQAICKVHAGLSWYVHDVITLDNLESTDYLLTPPAGNDWIHWGYSIDFTGIFVGELFEGATKTGGTAMTTINRDRNSLTASPMTVAKGPLSGSGDGTRIGWVQIGSATGVASKVIASYDSGDKRIFKAGTPYIVRVSSLSNDNVISLRMLN